jgi:hypothetical protein
MKKLLILFTILTALMAQDTKLRAMFVKNTGMNFIGAGVDYKFAKINKMPVFGTANFFFGSEGPISTRFFEVGATLRHQLNDDFYLKGATLMSFGSTSFDGSSLSATNSDFTLLVGAGYLINKQFSIVLDYGLTGADFFRIQLGFDL